MGKNGARKKEKGIQDLLQVACDLTELYVLITLMKDDKTVRDAYDVQVKGRGDDLVLLPTLKKCHNIIDEIDGEGENTFGPIHDEFDDLVNYLDENYSIKSQVWKEPENLRSKDLEKIADALDSIIRTFVGYADNLNVPPVNAKSDKKLSKFVKRLDKAARAVFKEALDALNLGLFTAAFMLFCRVGEQMAKTYYEKSTRNSPKDKSWDIMRQEISRKQHDENNVHWPILNLFGFLKEKRNIAQHPGERFDNDDCENIISILDEFQKEISKH